MPLWGRDLHLPMWMQEADQCLVEAVSFVFLLGLSVQQASAALETPTQPASRRVKKKSLFLSSGDQGELGAERESPCHKATIACHITPPGLPQKYMGREFGSKASLNPLPDLIFPDPILAPTVKKIK